MSDNLRRLIQNALIYTSTKQIEWDSGDSDTFRAAAGPGMLHIRRNYEPVIRGGEEVGATTTYMVQVTDARVRVVAECLVREGTDDYKSVNDLFEAARKSALRSEEVIAEMIHALQHAPAR